jgi:primosomal replication protein N''
MAPTRRPRTGLCLVLEPVCECSREKGCGKSCPIWRCPKARVEWLISRRLHGWKVRSGPSADALKLHQGQCLDKWPTPTCLPARLGTLATNLHAFLARVQYLLEVSKECPEAVDLERALKAECPEAIAAFMDRLARSLRRHDSRFASVAALEGAAPYFDFTWVAARRSAIEKAESNTAALGAIVDALPTLAAYQEFRIRASRLGEKERAIFRVFRRKEGELEKLGPNDLDACVRRTIGGEARLSWKLRLEAAAPELLLDTEALGNKIDALAQADSAIRVSNHELLINGIDPARVASQREWEEITRLRGPRALRLREFIDKATGLGLITLRPIWLMTPDVASRVLLPKAGMFDTVIYDESSQMPVEYSLPTLFRSKIVVVSGDDKQMPPTSFFSSKVESDEAALFDGEEPDDDASEEERDAYVETWNRREIKDCPDLLHLARVVLPTRTLQVHYRSAYRELIAFSNASFYGNRLSVPVRHPNDVVRKVKPIEVIRSDGLYKTRATSRKRLMSSNILLRCGARLRRHRSVWSPSTESKQTPSRRLSKIEPNAIHTSAMP